MCTLDAVGCENERLDQNLLDGLACATLSIKYSQDYVYFA